MASALADLGQSGADGVEVGQRAARDQPCRAEADQSRVPRGQSHKERVVRGHEHEAGEQGHHRDELDGDKRGERAKLLTQSGERRGAVREQIGEQDGRGPERGQDRERGDERVLPLHEPGDGRHGSSGEHGQRDVDCEPPHGVHR